MAITDDEGPLGPVGRKLRNIEPRSMSDIPVRDGLRGNQDQRPARDAESAPSPRQRQSGTDWEE